MLSSSLCNSYQKVAVSCHAFVNSRERSLQLQSIPNTMHSLDPSRVIGVLLDLSTQLRDVHIDSARGWKRGVAPHNVEKAFARHRLAIRLSEQSQHRKFFGRQME